MTAWKALITHSAIAQPVGGEVAPRTAAHSVNQLATLKEKNKRVQANSDLSAIRLSIPHHLEDLRVLRKSAYSAGRIGCLPDTEQCEKCADFTTALNLELRHPFFIASPTTGPPPLILPAQLRAQLQTWRI
ncbi:hypothetical protein ABZ918_22475 [Streptomyces viridosporus]|uniref:hypothetical protein n=1 Tax=Streptomyces viridosporus TaxID=67581 RepID=UPI00342F4443